MRLRACLADAWHLDVEIHKLENNVAGTCARIPLILELIEPIDNNDFSTTQDFSITAIPYNPDININGELVSVSNALGLTNILYGLKIAAKSDPRKVCVSAVDFTERV
jgi:hypothetical protein